MEPGWRPPPFRRRSPGFYPEKGHNFSPSEGGMRFAMCGRMLVVLAIGWVGAVFLTVSHAVAPFTAGAVVALLCAGALITGAVSLRSRLWIVPLGLLALLAGLSVQVPSSPGTGRGATVRLLCEVQGTRYYADRLRIDCTVHQGSVVGDNAQQLVGGTSVTLSSDLETDPAPGSVIRVLARLRPSRSYRNLSPHPRWPWVRPQAFAGTIVAGSLEVVEAPRFAALHAARAQVRRHVVSSLSPRAAGFVRALALGEGGAVIRDDRSTVAAAGLSHVLAVSGLHVALVSGALVVALRWFLLWLPFVTHASKQAALAGIPIAFSYAAFAGGTPSGWRAAVTASVTWLLVAMGRKPRSLPVAALTVLLLSIPNAAMATRPAFLLSVLATAAIITGGLHPQGALLASAHTTSRAIIATTPIVWWCFGGVPWVGWVSNLLLLPLATVALIPLANLHSLAAFFPALVSVTGPITDAVTQAFFAACAFMVVHAPAYTFPPLTVLQGVLVAFACLAVLSVRSWRNRLAVIACAVFLLSLAEVHARHDAAAPGDAVRVTFLDVGQGDAALIDLPDGRLVLVDAGGGIPDPGAHVLLPLLEARREKRIDLAVITHGHPDHYDGLRALVDRIDIAELWLPGQTLWEQPDGPLTELVAMFEHRGTVVRWPHTLCNGARHYGSATIEVLWPCPRYDPTLDVNDNSLVFRLTHQDRVFLFTGDIEREAELALARGPRRLVADVLKVAHHGSRTSSVGTFVRRVGPQLGVVSSGQGNRYGHPHPEVLERLSSSGLVLRTDEQGSIIVRSDRGGLSVRTWKEREWRAVP